MQRTENHDRIVAGGRFGIKNCVLIDEPADADPHVWWCERGRFVPAPYSIIDTSLEEDVYLPTSLEATSF